MNIFVDFHHAALLNSLIMLFEDRLSHQVYRPIGREWYDFGFWKLYDHPATVEQYLGINGATPDGTQPLNAILGQDSQDVFLCHDIDSGEVNKAITFRGFCAMQFDIVIATLPQHIEPFKNLITQYQPSAKLIYQIGNTWPVEANGAPNVMASAKIENVPPNINFIQYHQEFDLNLFSPPRYEPAYMQPTNQIASFVNCFNVDRLFMDDWQLFEKIEKLMPDWQFKALGGQCRDGCAHGAAGVAHEMKASKFIWHTKKGGDGYGHVIHNAFAVGRPPIIKTEYYKGKLAEDLLTDEVTCVAIDGLNPQEIVEKIKHFSAPDRYRDLCNNAIAVFREVVDFDRETGEIRDFLKNLK